MNDEQFLLANAYVDGELTDDELRTAHADPDVMAEVERLRALRAEIRAVPPATDDAREAAIAAAMSEYRTAGAGAAPERDETHEPAEPTAVPYRPRPAYARYLAVAAALVAVAGLGIVISQVGGGDNAEPASFDDAAIAEQSARDEVLSTVAEATASEDDAMAASEAVADAPSAEADEDGGAVGHGDVMEEAADESLEATEAPAEPDAALDLATDEALPRVRVPPGFDPELPIADEGRLAIYGSYLIEQRDLRLLPPTPETQCGGGGDVVLGTAVYIADGDVRPVYIAVDETDGLVLALDPPSCDVLAEADLFRR